MRRFVPSSQLMLGFDYPMMPAETVPEVWNMFDRDPDLTADDRHRIVQGTALDLFPTISTLINLRAHNAYNVKSCLRHVECI